MITRTSARRIATLSLAGVVVTLSLWLGVTSGHFPIFATVVGGASVDFARRNKRDFGTWITLATLFPLPAAIAMVIIDRKRTKALGLKWYQREPVTWPRWLLSQDER